MEKKMKILILTAPFGSGHLQVSTSLVAEFEKQGTVEVEEYDLYSNEYPIMTRAMQYAYLKTYKPIGKDVYRMLYYTASHAIDETIYARMLQPLMEFGKESLRNKVSEYQPDLIISVFPVTSLYQLLKKELNIPLYTVITDYYANGLWLYKQARRHYIASSRIARWGVEEGLSAEQFKLTGIPVHPKFYRPLSKPSLFSKYGLLPGRKTLLISAGTHGVLANVAEIAEELITDEKLQVIVVCGKNEKLFRELQTLEAEENNLCLIGYTQDMHELLEIADAIITKPGGISLTEAALKGVPVLMYKPVYGQELENAKYFDENRAGMIVANKTELMAALVMLLSTPGLLEEMKVNIQQLSHPFSAKSIVDDILKDILSLTLCDLCSKRHVSPDPLYPNVPPPARGMPPEVKDLYGEAAAILPLSPQASCVLLRSALHQLCAILTKSKANLPDTIQNLVNQGMPVMIRENLKSANTLGRHQVPLGKLGASDTEETARLLFGSLNLIVEKMYRELPPQRHLSWQFPNKSGSR